MGFVTDMNTICILLFHKQNRNQVCPMNLDDSSKKTCSSIVEALKYKALSFATILCNVASPKDLDQESQRRGREVEELEKRLAYAAAESRPERC